MSFDAPIMSALGGDPAEVQCAACECCGLTEECTADYIAIVRERHGGRWICGLCAEAVKDEAYRAGILITPEEAMARHAEFCRNFRSAASIDPVERLIAAVRHVLRRGLESSSSSVSSLRTTRSATSSPRSKMVDRLGPRSALSPSSSCLPAVLG